MLADSVKEKIVSTYHNRPLVIEGANGSIGLSVLKVLDEMSVKPSKLFLTSFASDPHKLWNAFNCEIVHLRSCEDGFIEKRKKILKNLGERINVIYSAGYGRPNIFLQKPVGVIDANIVSLLGYSEVDNILTFAYMSTSELYTGSSEKVSEDSQLVSTPQHKRAVYIEAKRLGEAIVHNIISKVTLRHAVYRIALATPPVLLDNDHRVLADLINSAINERRVHLKGGANLIRQYQYGPNAAYKILGSLVNGTSTSYVNAGSHVLTLGELAQMISNICSVPLFIDSDLGDATSPQVVLLDPGRIDRESGYLKNNEQSFEWYIRRIIHAKD